ncbi:MAG: chemotaxis protein CheW [Planctomycetaceae bacterium]|nr:chemotaxis protein CheW [Planctomycetaceae bacterium]
MSQSFGLLRCQLGDEAYGFEMSSVASVCHASAMLRPVVAAQGEPVGWISAPGEQEIPVYRLADCLGRSLPETDSRQHVVVVHTSLGPQGFLVGSVSRVLSIPAEQIQACPELLNDPARRLFRSVVLFRQAGQADSMIFVLSPERLHRHATPLTGAANLPGNLISWRALAPGSEVLSEREPDASAFRLIPLGNPVSPPLASQSGTNSERIVLFPLANTRVDGHELLCGLSVAQVAEILEPLPIIPVAFAPPHVVGFVMWREQAVPVLQLSLSLGVADAMATSRMMIVRQGSEFIALLTSQVLRARRLPLPHQPCPTPTGLDSAAILGTFQSESELLVVPNLSRLTRPQSLGA